MSPPLSLAIEPFFRTRVADSTPCGVARAFGITPRAMSERLETIEREQPRMEPHGSGRSLGVDRSTLGGHVLAQHWAVVPAGAVDWSRGTGTTTQAVQLFNA